MYTKYVAYKNSAKCNLNDVNFGNEFMKKKTKRESKELHEKEKCHYQIYIPIKVNIHIALKKLKMLVSYLIKLH